MPAAKQVKVLTEEEHYKLVDAKLAALMNAIPEPPPKKPLVRRVASPQTTDESETVPPPKAAAWSQRVSVFYKEQRSKNSAYTYKQALQEMKGK